MNLGSGRQLAQDPATSRPGLRAARRAEVEESGSRKDSGGSGSNAAIQQCSNTALQ